jgi:hypothetical protein
LLYLIPVWLSAATITGKVQDQMDRSPIPDALVILLKPSDPNFSRTAVSDKLGEFILRDIDPGTYHLEAARNGYFKNMLFDLKIEANQTYTLNIKLLKAEGRSENEYCFMLGGIEVCSIEKELIPESPVTTRKIDSGEIDHMQATSLGDILGLVPGIEKTNNPGLAKPTQVGIRSVYVASSSFDPIESFGAAIVVNGNQLSTNANATTQIYGSSGTQGLDLRTIPAENIKSVEVISGIPSVEYGNFGNGIIKVETKIGQIAPKVNAKLNPDTKSAVFSHGFKLGKSILDYNLNYGYSERDLRKVGDEFQRIYLAANLSRNYGNRLETRLSGSYTKLLDDEAPTDVNKIANYNRGYLASANFSADFQPNEQVKYKSFVGLNLNRKKAYKEKWVAEQYIWHKDTTFIDTVITSTDTSYIPHDTSIVVIDPGYIGKMQEIGHEWQFSTRFQRKTQRRYRNATHEFLTGIEYSYEKNTGAGLVIDTKYPYYGQYSSHRSYAFDDYPSLHTLSLYWEDQISARLIGKKINIMLGLRYDAFHSSETDSLRTEGNLLYKSNHGQFISPRINVQYFLSEPLRLRLGLGRSVKAVSLGYIFRPPAYYKYLDETGQTIEEVQVQYNPKLKAYSIDKGEISVDWKVSNLVGTTLTTYYSQSFNMPASVDYPWGYTLNPDTITDADYSIYENRGWKKSSGAEFSLRTNRIKNFQYRLNFTYRFEKSGRTGLTYDIGPDTSLGEKVWYKPPYHWSEKIIVDYQINYINNRLGVWITLEAQQIPLENRKTIYVTPEYTRVVDGVPRLWHQGMSYYYDRYAVSSGGRWLFNFRITKSLAHNAEVSLFVNNLFDDRASWKNVQGYIYELNPPIFYGMEVSAQW